MSSAGFEGDLNCGKPLVHEPRASRTSKVGVQQSHVAVGLTWLSGAVDGGKECSHRASEKEVLDSSQRRLELGFTGFSAVL